MLHRKHAAASFDYTTGTIVYYYLGNFHRDDGPALIEANGDFSWYRHGLLHRADGPAFRYEGVDEYWVDGVFSHKLPIL